MKRWSRKRQKVIEKVLRELDSDKIRKRRKTGKRGRDGEGGGRKRG